MKRLALLVGLLVFLTGCPAALQALSALSQGAQFLGSAIDLADTGQQRYFARHPHQQNQQDVATALHAARLAETALNASLTSASSAGGEDTVAARNDALKAYSALHDLLSGLGVLSATAPPGGAETDTPEPEPLPLPSPADLAARL